LQSTGSALRRSGGSQCFGRSGAASQSLFERCRGLGCFLGRGARRFGRRQEGFLLCGAAFHRLAERIGGSGQVLVIRTLSRLTWTARTFARLALAGLSVTCNLLTVIRSGLPGLPFAGTAGFTLSGFAFARFALARFAFARLPLGGLGLSLTRFAFSGLAFSRFTLTFSRLALAFTWLTFTRGSLIALGILAFGAVLALTFLGFALAFGGLFAFLLIAFVGIVRIFTRRRWWRHGGRSLTVQLLGCRRGQGDRRRRRHEGAGNLSRLQRLV